MPDETKLLYEHSTSLLLWCHISLFKQFGNYVTNDRNGTSVLQLAHSLGDERMQPVKSDGLVVRK